MKITAQDISKLGAKYKDVGIRQLREPLLKAFDIYKSNIAYGVETESGVERAEIMLWYQDLLDKKETALINIPTKIKRYL